MTPQELMRELAILLYQQGKLSFGKAKELARMDTWEFIALLTSRKIPCSYDLDEYEKEALLHNSKVPKICLFSAILTSEIFI